MEPPLKRPRLDNPHEILLQKRARNDLRLKSRFESIFEKFGKDFTGVGDEIDFQTGQIVVNNGHLTTMQGELDAEGLANEEDELATETPSELDPGKQSRRNGAMFTKSQEAEDNSAETVLEGPYGPEVACIGSSIAAAIKMEDGSSYDSTVHGELLIARNILSQLSCLGPHIRKSIANVQQSANTSKVVSIETDDLTVDPVWRVPVLVRPQFGMPSEEPPQKQSSIPEEARPVSPARSPSPAGHSLWSLDMPVNRSSPYEIAGARESKNNHNFLRKGRRMPRLLDKEEPMLRTLGTATNSTYQEPKTHFSDMAGKGQEQRRQSVEVSASEDSQFSSAKSSSRFASLPKNGEPEISTPIIGTISTTVDIPTSPAKIISAEMTACQPLSSHKSQGKRQGRQRRAEHARTAYQKLSSEEAMKRSEIPEVDKSQVNELQTSSKDVKIVEKRISPRLTKKAKTVESRNSAIFQDSPTEVSLTKISMEPMSSRSNRRTKPFKDISQLPKARRSRRTPSSVTVDITASKGSNEHPSMVLVKSSLAALECGNSQQLSDICEPSNPDSNTDENSELSRQYTSEMSSKGVSVVIVRQAHSIDQRSAKIVEAQSPKVPTRSTQFDGLTHVLRPRTRERPRSIVTQSQLHIGSKPLFTDSQTQSQQHSNNVPLLTELDCTPVSVIAHSHERESRTSNMENSRKDLSTSPDLATTSTPQYRENLKTLPSSKLVRESVSRKPLRKPVSGKRRNQPVSTSDSPSLTSVLGEFSDDELAHICDKGKVLLTTASTMPSLSAKARRCGMPGYKCHRTLCLICN